MTDHAHGASSPAFMDLQREMPVRQHLIHDLGRPAALVNLLRVFEVTPPMSVGSWLLAGYVPLTVVAAGTDVTGRPRQLGTRHLHCDHAVGSGP